MKKRYKISLLWIGLIALSVLPFVELDMEILPTEIAINSIQILLLILSIVLAVKDPTAKNRLIFVNFAVFFASVFLFYSSSFFPIGFGRHIFGVFSEIVYYSLNVGVVCYITIDLLFRQWKTIQKYALAVFVVVAFGALYYHPFFIDPLYAYHTERVLNWKELDTARQNFIERESVEPTVEQLTAAVRLNHWKEQRAIGLVSVQENSKRIVDLYPYLPGDNYLSIIKEPLNRRNINMNILLLGCILVYFGYHYKKDPPQGVYVDKVMFLFLMIGSMEIFHLWTFLASPDRGTVRELAGIGNYVTALLYLIMAVFFALRLKFITSIQGEFYEQELVTRPTKVTRWRSGLENFILKQFTSEEKMKRRLFAGNAPEAELSTPSVSESK